MAASKCFTLFCIFIFTIINLNRPSAGQFLEEPAQTGNFYQDAQNLLTGLTNKLQHTSFFLGTAYKEKVAANMETLIRKIADRVHKDLESFDQKKKEELEKGINVVKKFLDDLKHQDIGDKLHKLYETYSNSVEKIREQAKELSDLLKSKLDTPEELQVVFA